MPSAEKGLVIQKASKNWIKYCLAGGLFVLFIVMGIELQDNYRKYGDFRTMQDPITATESVDLTGLRELPYMGGPLISLRKLKKRFKHINGTKILIDGVHGKYGYVAGIPDSYLEYDVESPSWRSYFWRLFYTGTLKSQPSLVMSGADAAKSYGFEYRNFYIGSKYLSRDEDIDNFVSFFDTLPQNVTLYFHCIHGKGRTSMMLVMADIIKNAPTVALQDIVQRQFLLGSVDLFDTTVWWRATYKAKALEERKLFIEEFYAFICQRKAGGIQQWSTWKRQNTGV